MRLGREVEALEALDRAIAEDPDQGSDYRAKARVLWALGRKEEALAVVERAVEVDPGDRFGYRTRAMFTMWSSGSCEAALADLRKFEEMASPWDTTDTGSWVAWIHVSYVRRFCTEAYDAERTLELTARAVEFEPLNGNYLHARGAALYRSGRFDEAREALDRALAREFPADPWTLFDQSLTLSRLGLHDESRMMFDRGVARVEATWPEMPEYVSAKRESAEALGL